MDPEQQARIEGRLARIQDEIRRLGPLMRGSVTIMGERHKQPYFSVSINGKTRVMYLGDRRAEEARGYVANYRRLLELINEMTLLQMQRLKDQGTARPSPPTKHP